MAAWLFESELVPCSRASGALQRRADGLDVAEVVNENWWNGIALPDDYEMSLTHYSEMAIERSDLLRAAIALAAVATAACSSGRQPVQRVEPARSLEPVTTRVLSLSDSAQAIELTNAAGRPVRVWQIALFQCQNIYQSCRATPTESDIAPGMTRQLLTITRAQSDAAWSYYYTVHWRWTPPDDTPAIEGTFASYDNAFNAVERELGHRGYGIAEYSFAPEQGTRINVRDRLRVWVEQTRVGTDSLRLRITGERYAGDTALGRTSALRQDWLPITGGAAASQADRQAAETLRMLGDRLRAAIEGRAASDAADRVAGRRRYEIAVNPRRQPGDTVPSRPLDATHFLFCRQYQAWPTRGLVVDVTNVPDWCPLDPRSAAHLVANALVVADADSPPSGTRLAMCAAFAINRPDDWIPVAWYRDPKHCLVDGVSLETSGGDQPNMLLVERR
jgi:hypothetical protein